MRVVVVDDHPGQRLLVRQLLLSDGLPAIELEEAGSVAELMRVVAAAPPEVVRLEDLLARLGRRHHLPRFERALEGATAEELLEDADGRSYELRFGPVRDPGGTV